jgi:GNAT superfamily N-acetyltransferase
MKSLWARYHEETEGHQVIETDKAFVRYHISPPLCLIHDIYVAPEVRSHGHGKAIMSRVTQEAREKGCTHLWSQVGLGMLCANESLKANLGYGFVVQRAENGFIIMTKDLGV